MSGQKKIGECPVYGNDGKMIGTVKLFVPLDRFDHAMQLADERLKQSGLRFRPNNNSQTKG